MVDSGIDNGYGQLYNVSTGDVSIFDKYINK